ncbi:biotin carboxyl carrier protein [Deinococcus reticulitermitis]|uniref:Biotin carboxyl carrier protein of acetyl-CoA carboxylase n=1 Tax=Deinococcus reticulitermitis TaxID=856736 RepID=A0A1H6UX35_9DEIO|nr:acetyl-CoA carboxylase biotin carboxyl carrier protein [Deinococcus reticulitermitis]SEI92522.1 biotin carboxyl carrier protein [Deinococcus reticulitermitis]
MNPDDLKKILDALTQADVREFQLKTGSFDLSLQRGPQAASSVSLPQFQMPSMPVGYAPAPQAPSASQAPAAPSAPSSAASTEAPAPSSAPAAPQPAPAAAPAAPAASASKGQPVKAPIVGTFYASSSPDAPAYVKVGDSVQAGQVLCIIEAMKLMNEIEAETGGVIREILVKNAEPVEYGQTLFIIE